MKTNVKKLKKQRKFSTNFKRSLVKEFERGQYSVIQLSELHQISRRLIYSWIHKFSTFNEKGYRIVEHAEGSAQKVKSLEQKISELEAALGRKQIELDYLETLLEVAKEDLDIDLKKNYGTPRSNGCAKNPKI